MFLFIYKIINITSALLVSVYFVYIYLKHRHLFVKPSCILLLYSNVFYQWPLALFSEHYYYFFVEPYDVVLLLHSYVFFGIVLSSLFYNNRSKIIWAKLVNQTSTLTISSYNVVIIVLMLVNIILLSIYLYYVPFYESGLYVIITEPMLAAIAREDSFKLLENPLPRYSYSLLFAVFAPLLAGVAVVRLWLISKSNKKRYLDIFFSIIQIFAVAVIMTLTGARSGLVYLLLLVVLTVTVINKLEMPVRRMFLYLVIFIVAGIMLSFLREGITLIESIPLLLEYSGYIVKRMFYVPFDVGSWYVHHAQLEGTFGVVGFPRIAELLGMSSVNIPNLIGTKYGDYSLDTVSASAGYLFTMFSYIGWLSILFNLLGLHLIDIILMPMSRLNVALLLPLIALSYLITLKFIQSDYTVVWLTHGYGALIVMMFIVAKCIRSKR